MSDVPENDAIEQAREVEEREPAEPPHLDVDVPEADALEQAQEVPVLDEDYGA
jgi:hypothetical protein